MTGLTCSCGGLGSGKTANVVWLALQAKRRGQYIASNFFIEFADDVLPAEVLLLDAEGEFGNSTLSIDELWTIIDSRQSASGENEFLNKTILTSRKRGVTINGTAQLFHMLDKRFRGIADFTILCERLGQQRDLDAIIKTYWTFVDLRVPGGRAVKVMRFRVGDVAKYYDTNEAIESNKRLYVKEFVKRIREIKNVAYYENGGDEAKGIKGTWTLMDALQQSNTVTMRRNNLSTYAGVRRSMQDAVLTELGF
jgi:hypothetical protein